MRDQDIIQKFIDDGYPHMKNIPNNRRIFYTENSASDLFFHFRLKCSLRK